MTNKPNQKPDANEQAVWEIRVQGHLGKEWTGWFLGLAVILEDNGDTRLTGPVADQAALHGLIRKIRDAGMPLVSVVRLAQNKEG